MADSIISVQNISYTYEGYGDVPSVRALKNISFDVERGSFTAILGHNGSGKSTLASIMCMLSEPTEGQLYINGVDMTSEELTDEEVLAARRSVGMVFQNPDNQIVASVVEEDVAFGCENLGIPSSEIRERVDRALDTVGMKGYARHAPHKLSGGQKQRVAIAGVIAMDRECIIFDESTAMLDPMGRHEVMETIEKLNREAGVTVIIITHYKEEAARADKVIVMNDGELLTAGTPGEVFSRPVKLWDASLDVPQTTELLYRMKKAGYDVRLDIFDPEECAEEIARAFAERSSNGRA